jgi:hypothetical protein
MEEKHIDIEGEAVLSDIMRNVFWESAKKLWLIILLAVFMTPYMLFALFSGGFSKGVSAVLDVRMIFPFLPFLIILFSLYSVYSISKKSLALTKGKIQYSFGEDTYKVRAFIGNSELKWEGLQEIRETAKDFLFIQQKPRFVVIPKRWFQNEPQIVQFKELVRRKLGDKAKLKS